MIIKRFKRRWLALTDAQCGPAAQPSVPFDGTTIELCAGEEGRVARLEQQRWLEAWFEAHKEHGEVIVWEASQEVPHV